MTNRLAEGRCLHCGEKLIRIDGFPLCSKCEAAARNKYHLKKQGEKVSNVKPITMKFGKGKLTGKKMKERLGISTG